MTTYALLMLWTGFAAADDMAARLETTPAAVHRSAPATPNEEKGPATPNKQKSPPRGGEPPTAGDRGDAPSVADPFADPFAAPGASGEAYPAPDPLGAPASRPPATGGRAATPVSGGQPSAAEGGARAGAPQPLPAPPSAEPASALKPHPWRGKGYFAASLSLAGPLAGEAPARGNVLSLGGGIEAGLRVHELFALGMGLQAQPHAIYESYVEFSNELALLQSRPTLVTWDFVAARFFVPVRGVVQPFGLVSGGIASYELFPVRPERIGAHVRAGAGIDYWIAPTVSLELSFDYRAVFLRQTVGHMAQFRSAVVVHW